MTKKEILTTIAKTFIPEDLTVSKCYGIDIPGIKWVEEEKGWLSLYLDYRWNGDLDINCYPDDSILQLTLQCIEDTF